MTTITTEQAFTACEANKTAWLERRAEPGAGGAGAAQSDTEPG